MSMNDNLAFSRKAQEWMRRRGYWPIDSMGMKLMANELLRVRSGDAKARAELLAGLVELGLPVDTKLRWINNGSISMVALCVNAENRFPKGLEVLLQRGASIPLANGRYYTVLEDAMECRDIECVRILLQYRPLAELMASSAPHRDRKVAPRHFLAPTTSRTQLDETDAVLIAKLLLEAGLPVKGLLAHACSSACGDFPGAVDVLVDHGCDVNDPADPPLLVAAGAGKSKMLALLNFEWVMRHVG